MCSSYFLKLRDVWTWTVFFAGGLWPKWRIKLCITEPLTACAGAVTGPWEIHRDCLQHMSYIIASICTPTTTCKLQMCTSAVISAETEEGGKGGLQAKNQIALHCLFLSSLHCLNLGEKENAVIWKHNHAFMFFFFFYQNGAAFGQHFHHELWSLRCIVKNTQHGFIVLYCFVNLENATGPVCCTN